MPLRKNPQELQVIKGSGGVAREILRRKPESIVPLTMPVTLFQYENATWYVTVYKSLKGKTVYERLKRKHNGRIIWMRVLLPTRKKRSRKKK